MRTYDRHVTERQEEKAAELVEVDDLCVIVGNWKDQLGQRYMISLDGEDGFTCNVLALAVFNVIVSHYVHLLNDRSVFKHD